VSISKREGSCRSPRRAAHRKEPPPLHDACACLGHTAAGASKPWAPMAASWRSSWARASPRASATLGLRTSATHATATACCRCVPWAAVCSKPAPTLASVNAGFEFTSLFLLARRRGRRDYAKGTALRLRTVALLTSQADGARGCGDDAQALYFCQPFRERLLQHAESLKGDNTESLLSCLAELFQYIHSQKKKTGVVRCGRLWVGLTS
jgi:hypothetical protein